MRLQSGSGGGAGDRAPCRQFGEPPLAKGGFANFRPWAVPALPRQAPLLPGRRPRAACPRPRAPRLGQGRRLPKPRWFTGRGSLRGRSRKEHLQAPASMILIQLIMIIMRRRIMIIIMIMIMIIIVISPRVRAHACTRPKVPPACPQRASGGAICLTLLV